MALYVGVRFSCLCIFYRYQMKKMTFLLSFFILFFLGSSLQARQYNEDYLIYLIEEENVEGIQNFFSQTNYVSKVKHIIEFGEIFRSKLEERFGYKPSWREAYDCYKEHLQNSDLPKRQQKEFLKLFKSIVEFCEKSGNHVIAGSFNYRGEVDPQIEMSEELTSAYMECLGGALMCVIPSPITYTVGGGMIVDGVRRAYDHLEKNRSQERDYESSYYEDGGQPHESDIDSWDRDDGFYR